MTTSAAPEVLRYAAFTTEPAGGNPAGVVLDASGLGEAAMLAIAAEVGYSETAFVTAAPDELGEPGRAFAVRYFSPQREVPFCGHATVATAVALAERIGPGGLVFATQAGTVPVEVVADEDGVLRATLTSVEPYVEAVGEADVAQALAALGWRAEELDPRLPPRIAYAGARHLVLVAGDRARLRRLDYDFGRLAEYMTDRDLITLQLVWRESADTFHVRDPFPVGGVVEDPATGAAAAAFGAYLRELGEAGPDAVLTLRQGIEMGRPGVLRVELRDGDTRIRVSGAAVRIPAGD
ncbi:PhzF family phenazine biosynthesis isomerase [Actinoallomurus bryophytorum]|uniref:PhzF family phenazine biosynthesis protein n=1 Tax=Actinoallomurus bryophytorum TaxID=1490222 RepID=A0A543CL26_9ACTN|nr:PhzF family phenazine biosynthesis isomerase [Actinoallomurus bryophytorum]TQL97808.1 PhzF family phenazine biosynthesis protein [Actinoallomurus bryophytorum]